MTVQDYHNWAKPINVAVLDGLELVDAHFTDHVFPLHAHAEYVIGAVLSGAKQTQIGYRNLTIGRGQLTLFNPFEEHASYGAAQSWRFMAFYPTPALVAKWCEGTVPQFRHAVADDRNGAILVRNLYRVLGGPATTLDAEVAFVETLLHFFARHAGARLKVEADARENVQRARQRLDADLSGNIGLNDLAAASGLPPATFLRSFRRTFGCTPRVYSTARRIAAAKRALKSGNPPAAVAVDFGFCDQGHFTRVFHRWTGSTPGAFAQ